MNIVDILDPAQVKIFAGCSSRKRLFQKMAELAASGLGLESSRVIAALNARESLGSTAVGQGVALPHAQLPELDRIHGMFARFVAPVDLKAADKRPVDLVFVLLTPPEASGEHLKALATVSRMLRQEALCRKLRANDDPAALYALLTDELAALAA